MEVGVKLQKVSQRQLLYQWSKYVGGVADEIRKVTWGQIMEADYPAREQTFLQAMRGY